MALKKHNSRLFKVLGIFTGLQFLSALCAIIRAKLIALWIGPLGTGINSALFQTTELATMYFQSGARTAGVRELSQPSAENKLNAMALKLLCFRGGLILSVLFLLLSPALSLLMFGNLQDSWMFAVLSPCLWLAAYTVWQSAMLQASGQLARLAKASVYGIISASAISVPMFYLFRTLSIPWVILLFFATTALWTRIYRCREYEGLSKSEIGWGKGSFFGILWHNPLIKRLIKLSGALTASSVVAAICTFAFTVFLNRCYSTQSYGIYNAGYVILNTYLGMVFMALAVDFYPRLSRNSQSIRRMQLMITNQTSLLLSVITPGLVIFAFLAGFVINILYSPEYQSATSMVIFGLPGVVLRAVAFCMAYIILAKGDVKTYFLTESISGLLGLGLSIIGFITGSYAGLGIAYTLWFGIYAAIMLTVSRTKYGVSLPRKLLIYSLLATITVTLSSATAYLLLEKL